MLLSILEFFADANLQWVLLGTTLLGMISGMISVYTVLRGQSLLGDVLAHAALPGICLSYLLFGTKSMPLFFVGALVTGIVASFCIQWITNHSKLKQDAALAIVLSVFFGIGIVLMTFIQQIPNANQVGIQQFLFGQAASLVMSDLYFLATLAVLVLILVFVFFRSFQVLTFDLEFAKSLRMPVQKLNFLLLIMIAIVVILGIQIVGVVLMAALLITPALAARCWSRNMLQMVLLSSMFGALSGFFGTILSVWFGDIPTGPTIVLTSTFVFLISALLNRGKGGRHHAV
jgi:manganese/zinc/iron transport system permease protein